MSNAGNNVGKGKRGVSGKSTAANAGVQRGRGGVRGRATNPATGKVNKRGTGGGPGGTS